MPAVIYTEAADKAARFIMDCNQKRIPLIFVNDTTGFMVGRDSEQAGIIRSGAKMVNAMSNSIVPKISLIIGSTYGAGHYAMCGRAFDPFLTLSRGQQQSMPLWVVLLLEAHFLQIDLAARKRRGEEVDPKQNEHNFLQQSLQVTTSKKVFSTVLLVVGSIGTDRSK